MLKYLDYIIIILLFIGEGARVYFFHWRTFDTANSITVYLPLLYVLSIFILIRIREIINIPSFKWYIGIILVLYFFARFILRYGESYNLLNNLLIPSLMLFWGYDMLERGNSREVLFLLLGLYVLEVALAIIERSTGTLYFPYSLYNPDDLNGTTYGDYFRSNALLGHPLSNALFVATLMIFILKSKLNNLFKYSLYFAGLLAIFCFQARGALLLSIVFFIISNIINRDLGIKSFLLRIIPIFIGYFVISYLLENGYGDRIVGLGSLSEDESAMARVEAYLYMMQIDSSNLFQGIGIESFGENHIENWVLIYVLQYGIIPAILIVICIISLCFHALKGYDWVSKFCLFGLFISVASTNNSLANWTPAFPLFIICCLLFHPDNDFWTNEEQEECFTIDNEN